MKKSNKLHVLVILAVLVISSVVEAQLPQINSISTDTLTRSGRLRIFGTNFGSGGVTSQVLIDGHSAIITRWSSFQITAYVPELAGPGTVAVQVVTSIGASNTSQLTVMLRQPNDRIKWSFEADVTNLWFRPAIAPDGTVYVHGSDGFVFALSPDGGLKWVTNVNWYAYVPPAVGPDGTIYVGSIQRITAINPDGTERWQFNDPGTQGVHSGPAIGPEGNIYFANDFGLGAYSLSPNGQLLWNNPGTPLISWYGGTGGETVLGPLSTGGAIDQMYVVPESLSDDYTLQAFSLTDGSLRFSVLIGGQDDPFGQQQTQPAVGPNGTVYVTHMRAFGGIGWVLEAYSPIDGHSLWYYHGSAISGMTPPDVGPDGTVYYSQDLSRIIAFNPNTLTPNWQYTDGTLMYHPTVSPLNDMVVTGGVMTFGDVGFIKAISTSSGQLLWTVPLPGAFYPEPRVVTVHHPRFTPDGNTMYVSTTILGGSEDDPHSYLYAIATGDTTILVPTVMHVGAQTVTRELSGLNKYRAVDKVLVLDENNLPVEGVQVRANYSGPNSGRSSGTTGPDGVATLYSKRVINPVGTWCFEVVKLRKTGYTYDPNGNVVTTQCEFGEILTKEEFEVTEYSLEAYPNPFNPTTTISFSLPETGFTSLKIFDILGNKVADLVNEVKEVGIYEVRFDGSNLASGMYIYQLQTGDFFTSKKILLMK